MILILKKIKMYLACHFHVIMTCIHTWSFKNKIIVRLFAHRCSIIWSRTFVLRIIDKQKIIILSLQKIIISWFWFYRVILIQCLFFFVTSGLWYRLRWRKGLFTIIRIITVKIFPWFHLMNRVIIFIYINYRVFIMSVSNYFHCVFCKQTLLFEFYLIYFTVYTIILLASKN